MRSLALLLLLLAGCGVADAQTPYPSPNSNILKWIQSRVQPRVRTVHNGVNSISASATVTLLTFTRTSTAETFQISGYVVNASNSVAFNEASAVNGSDGVAYWLERTTTASTVIARAHNLSASNTRVLDWTVIGIKPR
jgi:hypothetical protein